MNFPGPTLKYLSSLVAALVYASSYLVSLTLVTSHLPAGPQRATTFGLPACERLGTRTGAMVWALAHGCQIRVKKVSAGGNRCWDAGTLLRAQPHRTRIASAPNCQSAPCIYKEGTHTCRCKQAGVKEVAIKTAAGRRGEAERAWVMMTP